jgi:hypothetical protein
MSDLAGDSLGGFELRLLEELKLLVEAPSRAAPPARRRRLPRSRFVLALAVVAVVVGMTAASIGAWRLVAKDARKTAILSTLQRGGHVGPLVASSGAWSLYAQRTPHGRTDWELSAQDVSAVGGFLGKRPLELTAESGASGYEVLAGQVNAPGAASVAVLARGHTTLRVPLEGRLFLVAVPPGARQIEAVLALDAAGKVVARARP